MKSGKGYAIADNMKYLLGEMWRFRPGGVLFSFAGIPAKVLVALTAIFVPKIVLDAIDASASPQRFAGTIGIVTLVLAATSLLDLFSRNAMEHCANSFILTHMNSKWVRKATGMDYSAYTTEYGKQQAEKARVSLEGTGRWGLGSYFPRLVTLLTCLLGFLSCTAVIAMLHPLAVLLLALCYAISLFFTFRLEKKKQERKDEIARVDRKLGYVAYKTRGLQIGKDIRVYSMAGWLRAMAELAKGEKRIVDQKIAREQFKLSITQAILVFVRDGVAYAFLIYQALSGKLTLGEFVLYFAAIAELGEWLAQVTSNIGEFTEANNSVSDFRGFMDIPDTMNRHAKAPAPGPDAPASIELKGVSFAYDKEKGNVLDKVFLHIEAGEKLAIVGANGAGKTTLVKLICGLLPADEGQIFLNGVDIAQFSRDEYYQAFTAVFQDSDVLPVSIADNIAMNEKVDETLIQKCLELSGLWNKVKSLPQGLSTNLVKHISENGTELSGGEKQKLLLARALYKKAPIIILDEPTAALDPIAEQEIYLKYNELTQNKTSLFISHRLSSTRFCDRIILLGEKGIEEVGTHDELMAKKGKYAALFDVQSQYYIKNKDIKNKDGGALWAKEEL
ncbi:MAG: ABC transporter ATP-binding protein/permease [Clostridiales bacterium]|nr:ABC transporter ATP-binding protein/permease [Clostridiales bacterium]